MSSGRDENRNREAVEIFIPSERRPRNFVNTLYMLLNEVVASSVSLGVDVPGLLFSLVLLKNFIGTTSRDVFKFFPRDKTRFPRKTSSTRSNAHLVRNMICTPLLRSNRQDPESSPLPYWRVSWNPVGGSGCLFEER